MSVESIEGERGIASVNSNRVSPIKRGVYVMCALLVVTAVTVALYLKFSGGLDRDVEQDDRDDVVESTVPARTFATPQPEPPPPAPALPPARQKPIVPVAKAPAPTPKPKPSAPVAKFDRGAGGMQVFVADEPTQRSARPAQGTQVADAGLMFGGGSEGTSESLNSMLTPTTLESTSAATLSDRNLIMAKGSYMPCGLNTQLDSTVPGITSCTVTRDIYSDNGAVLLVERGSTVNGEYRSNLRQGMSRIFVLWNRIKTPSGVVIDINSPATDSLGATGVPGQIDTHFWKRFGGAILLSLVDDAAAIASSGDQGDGNVIVGGTADTTAGLAEEVLRNTINIPPTLYANQGAQVGIYLARDLDFSSVYSVEAE